MMGRNWFLGFGVILVTLLVYTSVHAQTSKSSLKLNASLTAGFMEDSKTRPGVFIEIAKKIGEVAGFDIQIKFYPWPRSMKNTIELDNNIIVGLSRTPPREKKFTWIAPFMDLGIGFVTLQNPINSYAQAKQLGSVGLWKGSSYHDELKRSGFNNIRGFSTNPETDRAITLLEKRRLDTWYGDANEFKIRWQHFAKNKNLPLVFGKSIYVDTVWLAGGLKFPAASTNKLKSALEKIKANGQYKKIEVKYFGQN